MPQASVYATALEFKRAKPGHIQSTRDKDRVTAYWTYADMYRNVATVFQAVLRDAEDQEVYRRYIPSGRTVVEATNRYLARDLAWVRGPGSTATDEQFLETIGVIDALFTREEFAAKFMSLKRTMLTQGDAILHVTADAAKPEGSRISLTELEPDTYFTIPDPIDAARVRGVYLVSLILNDDEEEIAQRLEYHRVMNEEDAAAVNAPIGTVWTRLGFFEPDGWDDRASEGFSEADLKRAPVPTRLNNPATAALLQGVPLPSQITAIPVYHFRNTRGGAHPFGISELQGIESLIAGLTQIVTDEDLTVALQGLGVYATDSGAPVNPDGTPGEWTIAPGTVLELATVGGKFWRIEGVSTVAPMVEHGNVLKREMLETSGTPEVAVGKVDVRVEQSGVALAIQFAPVLAKNEEKELELKGKLDQFLFDLLNGWLVAFEGYSPNGSIVRAEFGNPLPTDRKTTIEELAALITSKIISAAFARTVLEEKLGYKFPAGMEQQIIAEQSALLDVEGARLDAAAAGEDVP